MRYIPLFFLLSSLGFFALAKPNFFKPHALGRAFHHRLPGLPQNTQTAGSYLWKALVTGDDSQFPRLEKRVYYHLGLGHLFTPSGVHLSYLSPLFKLFRYSGWLLVILALLGATHPDLLALSRVAWIKSLSKLSHLPSVFIIVLMLEGILNSWERSYLSWVCSWLFLGLSWFTPYYWRIPWFTLAQILLCWVLMQPFSTLAPVCNLLVSLPLVFLFPAVLISSFIPSFFLHD